MNEIANLCERVGANVDEVRIGVGSDRRIGPAFLFPGAGFGGSCFPKDVRALERLADEVGYEFPIVRAVHAVNESTFVEIVVMPATATLERAGPVRSVT